MRTIPFLAVEIVLRDRLTFFSRDVAVNIGWHEAPKREIFSRAPVYRTGFYEATDRSLSKP
jgi:hypothetical protein